MDFVSIRVITGDVVRMTQFYEAITGISVNRYTDDFVELITPSCTLAIADKRTIALFDNDVAHPEDTRTTIIEFRVDDVDAEYERVKPVVLGFVQEPTTMPWGNRSMLFRDPDGNLVNFFTPVTPAATSKSNE